MCRVLGAICAVVLGVSGCSDGGDSPATTETTAPTAKWVPHRIYTHCGVVSTTVAGVLWLADPPLSDGSGNPPRGWDENQTTGSFMQLSEDEAEFRTSSGLTARFRRAPEGVKDPLTGCA